MVKRYLQMLEQSLDQKKELLDRMLEMTETQKEALNEEPVAWDRFDELVEEKDALIDQLDGLDSGFENVYDRIREELDKDKEQYKDIILRIQKKIQAVSDASATVMAEEQRNKSLMECKMTEEKKKLQKQRVSSKAASNYYRSMNKVNFIDPQLMDKKN